MDFLTLAKKRRSVREYKIQKVSERDLNYVLDAGRWAPSANNLQNWRFIVVSDEEKKSKIANACHNQKWMADALLIVVCSLTKIVARQFHKSGGLLASQSTSAAIENMLLAATEKGLASCWCAITSEGKIKNTLLIPDNADVHAVIALGYPRRRTSIPQKLDVADLVSYDEWNTKEVDYAKDRFCESKKPLMERKAVKKLRKKLTRKKK